MEKRIPMRCRKHGTRYDAWDEQCPMCLADRSAYEYVVKRLKCGLCGKLDPTTTVMAGGIFGQLCETCIEILRKIDAAEKRRDEFHRLRRIEIDTQIFFRATFDNDPVEFIWG